MNHLGYPDELSSLWKEGPVSLSLPKEEVHLWCVPLTATHEEHEHLRHLLSKDETARADRLICPEKAARFTVGRARLRKLLGRYLDLSPQELVFSYSPQGKPSLSEKQTESLSFNLSHSEDLALVAIAHNKEIGIDLEYIESSIPILALAVRYFSRTELAELFNLSPDEQCAGFFNCWTRKEAYLKAKGCGINEPLSDFDVSLTPGRPAELVKHRTKPSDINLWSMQHINVNTQYIAAMVVEGSQPEVFFWKWTG